MEGSGREGGRSGEGEGEGVNRKYREEWAGGGSLPPPYSSFFLPFPSILFMPPPTSLPLPSIYSLHTTSFSPSSSPFSLLLPPPLYPPPPPPSSLPLQYPPPPFPLPPPPPPREHKPYVACTVVTTNFVDTSVHFRAVVSLRDTLINICTGSSIRVQGEAIPTPTSEATHSIDANMITVVSGFSAFIDIITSSSIAVQGVAAVTAAGEAEQGVGTNLSTVIQVLGAFVNTYIDINLTRVHVPIVIKDHILEQ